MFDIDKKIKEEILKQHYQIQERTSTGVTKLIDEILDDAKESGLPPRVAILGSIHAISSMLERLITAQILLVGDSPESRKVICDKLLISIGQEVTNSLELEKLKTQSQSN